jgi:hypothetical protein
MKKSLIILFFIIMSNLSMAAEFVINEDPKFIPDFKNRFSLLLGLNPSMTKTNQLKNVHLSYGKNKLENIWWDFNFTYIKGNFDKFTKNNASATSATDAQMNETTDASSQISFGAGIMHETQYIQTLVPFTGMYELMSASATYNLYKDANSTKTFSGPGIIAKLSVLKKFSDYLSFGGNFIYNLAVVKRGQDTESESSSSRSLTLSNITFGIDLSLYL